MGERTSSQLNGPITYRDATVEDAAVIAEIYNQSIVAGGSTMDDELKTPEDIRRQISGFDSREVIILQESRHEQGSRSEVIGWGIIKRYSDRGGYRFAGETSVYLRRDQMLRGLGTRLKKVVIQRCRELDYHHLVARIFADNEISIGYNQRLGYELVGIQREIGFKDGVWKDVAVLQLVLEEDNPESSS